MAVKGTFQDISFVELLQLMDLTRKTGRLEVSFQGKWAMIIFQEGAVWHVEPRGFRGASQVDVLYEIIAMEEGNFVFQRLQLLPTLERTVNMSIQALIMEGTKRLDDGAVIAEQVGGDKVAQVLRIKEGSETKLRYVPQNVKRVVMAIDGKRTMNEVVQKSQLEPDQAAEIIKDLIAQDVVETVEIAQSESGATAVG